MDHPRQIVRVTLLVAVAGLAPVAGACRALDPNYTEPAIIVLGGDTAAIIAPDTVPRAAGFPVTVETFGDRCTHAQIVRTEKKVTGSLVEIRPFNETTKIDGRATCAPDFVTLSHTVTIEIKQPGPATIRVIGEERDFVYRNKPAQIQRMITVR